jgi:hypothetical protein
MLIFVVIVADYFSNIVMFPFSCNKEVTDFQNWRLLSYATTLSRSQCINCNQSSIGA